MIDPTSERPLRTTPLFAPPKVLACPLCGRWLKDGKEIPGKLDDFVLPGGNAEARRRELAHQHGSTSELVRPLAWQPHTKQRCAMWLAGTLTQCRGYVVRIGESSPVGHVSPEEIMKAVGYAT